jgi:hypothetical protein
MFGNQLRKTLIDIRTTIYRLSQTTLRPLSLCIGMVVLSFAIPSICVPAAAQITLDVIGPHEYDLPVGFKPFDIFVEYGTMQTTGNTWDANGNRHDGPDSETLISLSKYVHFWTPQSMPKLGLGWEFILPASGTRDTTDMTSSSGIGDPITGPALWFKPTQKSTLGAQLFVQAPIGMKDVGGGDQWKYYICPFTDVRMGKLGYTADGGTVLYGHSTMLDGRQSTLWFTGQRLGYQITDLLEPFFALDSEYQSSSRINVESRETSLGLGIMFHLHANRSLTVRYSAGVVGENHSTTNTVNIKYIYIW